MRAWAQMELLRSPHLAATEGASKRSFQKRRSAIRLPGKYWPSGRRHQTEPRNRPGRLPWSARPRIDEVIPFRFRGERLVTPKEVLATIREREVKAVDLRFNDFPGRWQHVTIPADALDEAVFEDGIGFDGASVRGWKAINESDMLLLPESNTAFVDPFCRDTTLTLICNIQEPLTKEDYSRDPRNIARKAVNHMRATGTADAALFGPTLEFFVFDDVRFDQTANSAFYAVDSAEGSWNTGRSESPNLGYKVRPREGYSPTPPADALNDLRTEMMLAMRGCGLHADAQAHGVATGGQGQIALQDDELVRSADAVMKFKYVVKNVARRHGKAATFMPKPLFGDNGSGLHVQASLWRDGRNLFAGAGYAGLSDSAEYAIGGLLKHASSFLASRLPTRRRIRINDWFPDSTGRESGVFAANRSAAITPSRCIRPARRPAGSNIVST